MQLIPTYLLVLVLQLTAEAIRRTAEGAPSQIVTTATLVRPEIGHFVPLAITIWGHPP